MSALRSILKEELQRLEVLCRKCRAEIARLPKGSISEKERKGKLYAYLAYREKDRVVFKYLGRVQSNKVMGIEAKIKSRKRYENLLKKVQSNLKELRRALHE